MKIEELYDRISTIREAKEWDKSALQGGCYIHLEVSEFIEALRGKGSTSPAAEAGDVLIALCAVLSHYNITVEQVLGEADATLARLENR